MRLLLVLPLLIGAIYSPKSHSALTLTPTVPGYSPSLGSSGLGGYKPMSLPQLVGQNFKATGQVVVNGRPISIPGYLPPAGTAAQAAKNAFWLNPLLTGAALLAWSGDAGLNSGTDGWTMTVPGEPSAPGTGSASCITTFGTGAGDTYGAACEASLRLYYPNWCPDYNVSSGQCHKGGSVTFDASTAKAKWSYDTYCTFATCSGGYTQGQFMFTTATSTGATVSGSETTPQPTTRPATQDDFNALPAPSVEALAELAPQVGVDVDTPVYDPVDLPIGDIYTKPDGSTAEPRAKITPASGGQVTVDTYDQPITAPDGTPVTNPQPVDTQEAPPPTPSQCEKSPDTLGCSNLDEPTAEDLQTEQRGIDLISPVSIGGAGTCPAPLTVSAMGQTFSMPLDPLCQYATTLRPLVLALSWLSAGIIFIGGVKNG